MLYLKSTSWACVLTGMLAACGDSSNTPAPGDLLTTKQMSSLNSSALATQLTADPVGQQSLDVAGTPKCGVDFHSYEYRTVGSRGEATTASGAILAPTGAAGCTGARPILLYAHGTAVSKAFNMADFKDVTNDGWQEAAMVAAFYAAQGYIVVAPNYAGYDTSTLAYHPYLHAEQQSQDMINALAAARAAIRNGLPSGVSDNSRLFITGYSQGGHVAMATMRAMQAANIHFTAASPQSGPYALLSLVDNIFAYSSPNLGSTIYFPMLVNGLQNAYGDLYSTPSDIYTSTFVTGIETLIPGPYLWNNISASGKLPELALFNSTTPGTGTEPGSGNAAVDAILARPSQATNLLGYLGFGSPYLIKNSMRIAYALDAAGPAGTPDGVVPTATTYLPPASTPANHLRAALKKNDLRGYSPTAPTMLCGGMNDPVVSYPIDTLTMKALWTTTPPSASVAYVDVDPSTNGAVAKAGQIADIIGGITATVIAGEAPGTAPATISADVKAAIIGNAAFAAYFTSGAPNSPQGWMTLGLANVAAQTVKADLTSSATTPVSQIAGDVGFAVTLNYHYPLAQIACKSAARQYFAAVP